MLPIICEYLNVIAAFDVEKAEQRHRYHICFLDNMTVEKTKEIEVNK